MTIKMIVTDLDGTLLNSANTISDKNIQAFKIAKNHGVIPVVATGRIENEALIFAQAIGAGDYVISGNGGVVKDHINKKMVHEVDMDKKVIHEFLELFDTYDEVYCQAHTTLGCVCTEKTFPWMDNAGWAKAYVDEYKHQQIVVKDIEDFVTEKNLGISKFVLSSANEPNLKDIMEKAGKINGIVLLRPMVFCIECIPIGVNKGLGIIKLCDYLGIELKEVMVIGDSDNDQEMFEIAGPVKVAMGNANSRIKELATYVVSSNDEDGVAEAIEEFVIKGINQKKAGLK